jgi:aspartate-semialdehyde dehydrogenase
MSAKSSPLYNIAVVGATGNVGREIINTLHERNFPVAQLLPVASNRSLGQQLSFGDQTLDVIPLEKVDFQNCDLILSSCGSQAVQQLSEILLKIPFDSRPVLIDNSSHFRMDENTPLVVPEVNPHTLSQAFGHNNRKIIANPNCSTIQSVVVLDVIHKISPITRVVASTYQSVSGAGKKAMDELFNQTRGIYVNQPVQPQEFTKKIAFNVIPHIDVFLEGGITKEEWKMSVETQKILDPKIKLHATCVRVPVFVGHGVALHIECTQPIEPETIRKSLRKHDAVAVVDHPKDNGYVSPEECTGEDLIYVSRIRKDNTVEHGISLWVVSDNLRKGAALNAVQIAETLIEQKLLS